MAETHIPYDEYVRRSEEEMRARARSFHADMKRRRSVREFSSEPVPRDLIETCVQTAASAPSGADGQPWHFVVVTDPATKERIRSGAEEQERKFYASQSQKAWHEALTPLGTNPSKPFLTAAPVIIAVFSLPYQTDAEGLRSRNYYVKESVGMATGLLVAALHHCGLATLTYSPNPMGFLRAVLHRPENERPYMVIVTGYPSSEATVPAGAATKKALTEIATFVPEPSGVNPQTLADD